MKVIRVRRAHRAAHHPAGVGVQAARHVERKNGQLCRFAYSTSFA